MNRPRKPNPEKPLHFCKKKLLPNKAVDLSDSDMVQTPRDLLRRRQKARAVRRIENLMRETLNHSPVYCWKRQTLIAYQG